MAPGGPGGPGTVRVDDPSENRRHVERGAPLSSLRGDPGQAVGQVGPVLRLKSPDPPHF